MPDPTFIAFGPFTIRWYGIMLVAGMIVGVALGCLETKRLELNTEHYFNMCLMALVIGVLGARAYYVIFNWDYYGANPAKILAFTEGGLAIHGGLIAGGLVYAISGMLYRIGGWRSLDITAPSVAIGQAIGRWGNFFNQEAFGYPLDKAQYPWAMYIAGEYRHPTFLYESIWDFCVFAFLLWYRKREKTAQGDVILSYLMLYSLGRIVIEGLRTDSLMFGEIRVAQAISAAAILVSFLVMVIKRRNKDQGGKITSIR